MYFNWSSYATISVVSKPKVLQVLLKLTNNAMTEHSNAIKELCDASVDMAFFALEQMKQQKQQQQDPQEVEKLLLAADQYMHTALSLATNDQLTQPCQSYLYHLSLCALNTY